MMAAAEPPSSSSFLPLLESVEDSAAGQSEQTDAYLTIANRLSGEEGRQFLPAVEKHFSRLGEATLTHITSPNAELSQAALQALGFCVYHSQVVSGVSETLVGEILTALCSLVVKTTDKNTCTRALWVISKQSFPSKLVAKKVSSILGTLEAVLSREDIQSVVMEHEALNVVIRMLEQVPAQMGERVVRWAKLIIPLVIHSASKVRLRAAAAMEMGMPLLLQKQTEVAAIIEPMMSTKLIPELQKLFMSKNETNVLKLWPLFVKLLGKLLHRGGPFINSLLHLEELGFRSSSPSIKKIAFIAWKSLIDNFALNPDILCSSKRMKLLMQPLASIHVRTEALMLTKVEVWWYLVVQLGPNLSANFDQVALPLLQCTIGSDSPTVPGTPSRPVSQNGSATPATPKTAGPPGFSSPANTSRMSLNSSVQHPTTFPSIQLLGLEMLTHFFLGPDVLNTTAKNKIILSLEPLTHPLLTGASSFTKHAAVLTSSIRDGFINVGKDAPDSLLTIIWTSLVRFVNFTIESGSKKDRQGCEVLTLMLQALQSIVTSEVLPAEKVLILFKVTVKGIHQRVLGSASYQVGKMDVLNGTPALFLILLLYNSSTLSEYLEDERFFECLQTLVGCGLSGHTSPLAFGEAVLGGMRRSAETLQNKEQLWKMWSMMVSPLTETITKSNEVNQGDALEHNFSAMHSALMFPVAHLLKGTPLQQASQKSMLSTWSKLYKVFARCSALVVTAEENVCCEELCTKMTAALDKEALMVPSTLSAVSSILQVMMECVDFSPYTPRFQQKHKSPHTPVNWTKKRSKVLGNLTTFQSLLVQCLDVYLEDSEAPSEPTGLALTSILSTLFSNLLLANTITAALTALIQPLTLFYKQTASKPPRFSSQLQGKLEKLLPDVLGCLQTCSTLTYDDELLTLLTPLLCVLFPHESKQLRTSVTQFWNATFAKSDSLTYPDEIRPILSQVKVKTPIILPGFEVLSIPDELSGLCSSESSQMETKLSGMPISTVGKRDSLLGKTPEMKERSSTMISKPVSTKLDFGSPKHPRRAVLEEEASIDFVFIPPETKERVLTEHQKEVKRTKRVDIPAMYNNLDASLDTTAFTQYTQSQEDTQDKLPAEQTETVTEEAPVEVPQEHAQNEEDAEVLIKDTQDYASPKAVDSVAENQKPEELIPKSTDVSMEDVSKTEDKGDDSEVERKQDTSPNISGSSDLVSGTPQKPNSRRQSFITLEKYAEGKPASPSSVSKFTGPLVKTSNSQECTKKSSSQTSMSAAPNSQESQSTQVGKVNSQSPVKDTPDSPVRPKDSGTKCEPVRLTDRLPSDTTEEEDVIPDTQTEAGPMESIKTADVSQEIEPSSQEEEFESTQDDSQSSANDASPSEPRRSGRPRVRPLRPGEDPEVRDQKFQQPKRKRSEGESKGDSPKSNSIQSRPNTRGKIAAEEDSSRVRLRSRTQRDKGESSQTNSQGRSNKRIKLYSFSQDFLDQPEPRRRSTRDLDSSQSDLKSDTQSDSQSQGRIGRRSRSSVETTEEPANAKKDLPNKESKKKLELVEQAKKDQDEPMKDSTLVTSTPKVSSDSQEFDLIEQTVKDGDSQMDTIPPPEESQDMTSETNNLVNDVKGKTKDTDEDQSQEDSQAMTPSLDSQSLCKSRRSKALSDSCGQSQALGGVETAQKKEEDSQIDVSSSGVKEDSQDITLSSSGSQSVHKSRRSKASSDSQSITSSSQADGQSQESQIVKKGKRGKRGSNMGVSSLANDSQDEKETNTILSQLEEPDVEPQTKEELVDIPSQDDSQVITPSSSDSQSVHTSRRSKASSDSQSITSSSQVDGQSLESQIVKKGKRGKRRSHIGVSSPANDSQDGKETNTIMSQLKEPDVEPQTKEELVDIPSQDDSQVITPSSLDTLSTRRSRRSKASSDSQSITSSPQTDCLSQESQIVGKTTKEKSDSLVDSSSPASDSQKGLQKTKKLTNEPCFGNEHKAEEGMVDNLSQQDSQVVTLSSESQGLSKSRRSKTSATVDPADKTMSNESVRRQRRSNAHTTPEAVEQVEIKTGGRAKRSMVKEEQSKSSPSPSLESSQSLEGSGSSQGRGRPRRSSQAFVASVESTGSESSEVKESPVVPKKRGRKPRASLQSPVTISSQEDTTDQSLAMDDSQSSQVLESQNVEAETLTNVEGSTTESLQVTSNTDEQGDKDAPMEVEDEAVVQQIDTETTKNSEILAASPRKEAQRPEDSETKAEDAASKENEDLKPVPVLESVGICAENTQEELSCDTSTVDKLAPPGEMTEQLQVSESSEEKSEASQPAEKVPEEQNENSASNSQENEVLSEEDSTTKSHDTSFGQSECPDAIDDFSKDGEQPSAHDATPVQDSDKDTKPLDTDGQDVEDIQTVNPDNDRDADVDAAPSDDCNTSLSEPTSTLENGEKLQGSPAKQKDLEAVMGQDVGQSPGGGRTRGSWSPSASPSTSILKKGQKRPLEDETPSPLVKSRRVSFANPIQQQETADDIDRRSPALRTSSPRRSKGSSIPQPKYITTPTKGMLILSPRNLHSPGYKSSKKCLISEMSQEPRPVSRDCIYPALVGCSAPVEAVLPQISSNMWPRGFGQLVRARNIRTVGDLSALTPGEIKTLPIRSPKISNVKKALKIYEQQRKGRGGDELKSFDETEMMTSELEETNAPQNQDEEDKVSGETLATELIDEPAPAAESKPEDDVSKYLTPDTSPGEQRAGRKLQSEGLLSEVEALSCRMTPLELSQCSPQQLVQIHDQLGGAMRRVVVEMQTRLCQTDGKP
ncbi:telomere-associated protein RIF1 isoform X2 [Xyrichtys novacula]|uniref:Telomere-associated protein RIF1 isoform X2 n=1 Tax=Xyrichtys novacula TaxID=13765 RepID=A0AAV1GZN8_XYRNO|nr:telomere-associated protein RIF1 isoform X2 [Xyrichtys novacula]